MHMVRNITPYVPRAYGLPLYYNPSISCFLCMTFILTYRNLFINSTLRSFFARRTGEGGDWNGKIRYIRLEVIFVLLSIENEAKH